MNVCKGHCLKDKYSVTLYCSEDLRHFLILLVSTFMGSSLTRFSCCSFTLIYFTQWACWADIFTLIHPQSPTNTQNKISLFFPWFLAAAGSGPLGVRKYNPITIYYNLSLSLYLSLAFSLSKLLCACLLSPPFPHALSQLNPPLSWITLKWKEEKGICWAGLSIQSRTRSQFFVN